MLGKGKKIRKIAVFDEIEIDFENEIIHATNCPTIACFDAGNIEKNLKELTTKFKDKNFIIAADNDRFKLNKETNKIEEKTGAYKTSLIRTFLQNAKLI